MYEVDKDLSMLLRVESDLIYNINLHKKEKIVTVISEYHKSIEKLKEVRNLILIKRGIKSKLENNMESQLKSYEYYLDEYEKEYEKLNTGNVILLFRKVEKDVKKED